eukprot:SAG11_NODE_2626_length_3163_cov_1.351175_4_plen_65_part_00
MLDAIVFGDKNLKDAKRIKLVTDFVDGIISAFPAVAPLLSQSPSTCPLLKGPLTPAAFAARRVV